MVKEDLQVRADVLRADTMKLRVDLFKAICDKYGEGTRFDEEPIETDNYEIVAVRINYENYGDSYIVTKQGEKRVTMTILSIFTPIEVLFGVL